MAAAGSADEKSMKDIGWTSSSTSSLQDVMLGVKLRNSREQKWVAEKTVQQMTHDSARSAIRETDMQDQPTKQINKQKKKSSFKNVAAKMKGKFFKRKKDKTSDNVPTISVEVENETKKQKPNTAGDSSETEMQNSLTDRKKLKFGSKLSLQMSKLKANFVKGKKKTRKDKTETVMTEANGNSIQAISTLLLNDCESEQEAKNVANAVKDIDCTLKKAVAVEDIKENSANKEDATDVIPKEKIVSCLEPENVTIDSTKVDATNDAIINDESPLDFEVESVKKVSTKLTHATASHSAKGLDNNSPWDDTEEEENVKEVRIKLGHLIGIQAEVDEESVKVDSQKFNHEEVDVTEDEVHVDNSPWDSEDESAKDGDIKLCHFNDDQAKSDKNKIAVYVDKRPWDCKEEIVKDDGMKLIHEKADSTKDAVYIDNSPWDSEDENVEDGDIKLCYVNNNKVTSGNSKVPVYVDKRKWDSDEDGDNVKRDDLKFGHTNHNSTEVQAAKSVINSSLIELEDEIAKEYDINLENTKYDAKVDTNKSTIDEDNSPWDSEEEDIKDGCIKLCYINNDTKLNKTKVTVYVDKRPWDEESVKAEEKTKVPVYIDKRKWDSDEESAKIDGLKDNHIGHCDTKLDCIKGVASVNTSLMDLEDEIAKEHGIKISDCDVTVDAAKSTLLNNESLMNLEEEIAKEHDITTDHLQVGDYDAGMGSAKDTTSADENLMNLKEVLAKENDTNMGHITSGHKAMLINVKDDIVHTDTDKNDDVIVHESKDISISMIESHKISLVESVTDAQSTNKKHRNSTDYIVKDNIVVDIMGDDVKMDNTPYSSTELDDTPLTPPNEDNTRVKMIKQMHDRIKVETKRGDCNTGKDDTSKVAQDDSTENDSVKDDSTYMASILDDSTEMEMVSDDNISMDSLNSESSKIDSTQDSDIISLDSDDYFKSRIYANQLREMEKKLISADIDNTLRGHVRSLKLREDKARKQMLKMNLVDKNCEKENIILRRSLRNERKNIKSKHVTIVDGKKKMSWWRKLHQVWKAKRNANLKKSDDGRIIKTLRRKSRNENIISKKNKMKANRKKVKLVNGRKIINNGSDSNIRSSRKKEVQKNKSKKPGIFSRILGKFKSRGGDKKDSVTRLMVKENVKLKHRTRSGLLPNRDKSDTELYYPSSTSSSTSIPASLVLSESQSSINSERKYVQFKDSSFQPISEKLSPRSQNIIESCTNQAIDVAKKYLAQNGCDSCGDQPYNINVHINTKSPGTNKAMDQVSEAECSNTSTSQCGRKKKSRKKKNKSKPKTENNHVHECDELEGIQLDGTDVTAAEINSDESQFDSGFINNMVVDVMRSQMEKLLKSGLGVYANQHVQQRDRPKHDTIKSLLKKQSERCRNAVTNGFNKSKQTEAEKMDLFTEISDDVRINDDINRSKPTKTKKGRRKKYMCQQIDDVVDNYEDDHDVSLDNYSINRDEHKNSHSSSSFMGKARSLKPVDRPEHVLWDLKDNDMRYPKQMNSSCQTDWVEGNQRRKSRLRKVEKRKTEEVYTGHVDMKCKSESTQTCRLNDIQCCLGNDILSDDEDIRQERPRFAPSSMANNRRDFYRQCQHNWTPQEPCGSYTNTPTVYPNYQQNVHIDLQRGRSMVPTMYPNNLQTGMSLTNGATMYLNNLQTGMPLTNGATMYPNYLQTGMSLTNGATMYPNYLQTGMSLTNGATMYPNNLQTGMSLTNVATMYPNNLQTGMSLTNGATMYPNNLQTGMSLTNGATVYPNNLQTGMPLTNVANGLSAMPFTVILPAVTPQHGGSGLPQIGYRTRR